MGCYWVRLAGYLPLDEIAAHTPPTWETLADGGIGEVSFALALSVKAQHQLLSEGVKVEVMLGATPVATALMTEPDRTTWEVKAQGLSAAAYKVAALNSLGDMTRDVGQVLQNVIATGWWQVRNPRSVGGGKVVLGDETGPQTVGQLLDNLAVQEGMRWGVDGGGRLFMRPDPTVVTCHIEPGAAAFGTTDEDRATRLVARYTAVGGAYATRIYPSVLPARVIDEIVDLTGDGPDGNPRGELTTGQVDTILEGMMGRGKDQTRWTNGVTLTRDQITRKGVSASLPTIVAGEDMARATGVSATFLTSAPWLDVVVGKTRYTAGESVIYVEPLNTAPRTLTAVLAAS